MKKHIKIISESKVTPKLLKHALKKNVAPNTPIEHISTQTLRHNQIQHIFKGDCIIFEIDSEKAQHILETYTGEFSKMNTIIIHQNPEHFKSEYPQLKTFQKENLCSFNETVRSLLREEQLA